MAGPGRKTTPAALKLIKGNPGKRPVPETPDVPIAAPDKPEYLKGKAAEIWERIVPHLVTAQLCNPLCGEILALLCEAAADYRHAKDMLERPEEEGGGYMVTTPNNYKVQSQWLAVKNKAFEQMMKVGVEFGMTPSALARVSGSSQMPLFPENDPMEAMLQAHRGLKG